MNDVTLEVSDIQGLVLYAYKRKPEGRFLFVKLEGPPARARAWLRGLLPEVDSARPGATGKDVVQVAFTASGLAQLGLGKRSLATFPREFQQGMGDPERARVLRDTGINDPAEWELGGPRNARIDAVLLLYAASADAVGELAARFTKALAASGAGAVVANEAVRLDAAGREHFGFHDGISQPSLRGSPRDDERPVPDEHRVAPGEIVLGYPNQYGLAPESPRAFAPPQGREPRDETRAFDLGKNGSFLVLRKLAQDVAGFWSYAYEHAAPRGSESQDRAAERLASRMVGRWPGGAPVVLSPEGDSAALASANVFGFQDEDPDGRLCPFGAHVRRAFPRDMLGPTKEESWEASQRHRILRRGRLYGPRLSGHHPRTDDGQERGLYFAALCASVRRQFEFIQQTWITSPIFAGLRDEMDPLLGHDPRSARFTMPGKPVRRCLAGIPAFVRVRGGGYFFLPGLRALSFLASSGDEPPARR